MGLGHPLALALQENQVSHCCLDDQEYQVSLGHHYLLGYLDHLILQNDQVDMVDQAILQDRQI